MSEQVGQNPQRPDTCFNQTGLEYLKTKGDCLRRPAGYGVLAAIRQACWDNSFDEIDDPVKIQTQRGEVAYLAVDTKVRGQLAIYVSLNSGHSVLVADNYGSSWGFDPKYLNDMLDYLSDTFGLTRNPVILRDGQVYTSRKQPDMQRSSLPDPDPEPLLEMKLPWYTTMKIGTTIQSVDTQVGGTYVFIDRTDHGYVLWNQGAGTFEEWHETRFEQMATHSVLRVSSTPNSWDKYIADTKKEQARIAREADEAIQAQRIAA